MRSDRRAKYSRSQQQPAARAQELHSAPEPHADALHLPHDGHPWGLLDSTVLVLVPLVVLVAVVVLVLVVVVVPGSSTRTSTVLVLVVSPIITGPASVVHFFELFSALGKSRFEMFLIMTFHQH
jgi:hypothetical protein